MNLNPERFEFYCNLKNHKNGRNLGSQICSCASSIGPNILFILGRFMCCQIQPHPQFLGIDMRHDVGTPDFRRQFSQQPLLAFWVSNVTFANSWSKFHPVPDPHRPPLRYIQFEDKGSSERSTEQMWFGQVSTAALQAATQNTDFTVVFFFLNL